MGNDAEAIAGLFRAPPFGTPEDSVGYVLWRVANRYLREVDRALVAAGVDATHLQFETLIQAAWLGRSGPAASQAEIARFGGIHPMQVSLMVKALDAKGLVRRARDPADERVRRVELTAAGLDLLRRGKPVLVEVQRRLFGADGAPGGPLLVALLAFCPPADEPRAPDPA